jgi:hypothetical protein
MIRQDQQNSRTQKQMESMTEEQREKLIDTQTKVAPIFAYVAVVLLPFIGAVVVGAVLMLAFNLIYGTKIGFAPSLGIVSYSWVPGIIGALLGILIIIPERPVHGGSGSSGSVERRSISGGRCAEMDGDTVYSV